MQAHHAWSAHTTAFWAPTGFEGAGGRVNAPREVVAAPAGSGVVAGASRCAELRPPERIGMAVWVPIIRSWALTRGFALHPGTRNRYKIRYTRTQHRPASRQVNDHGQVSGTHRASPDSGAPAASAALSTPSASSAPAMAASVANRCDSLPRSGV